jgi:hypothetical protein
MNQDHLGDTLDYWKGWILGELQQEKLLQDLAVDPMLTDSELWSGEHLSRYRSLLKVDKIHPNGSGDLFLDPSTGIYYPGLERHKNYDPRNYLPAGSLLELFDPADERVVAVYQDLDNNRKKQQEHVDRITSEIWTRRDTMKYKFSLTCYPHMCGQVAMLFFSRNAERIGAIRGHFQKLLHYPEDAYPKCVSC